MCGRLWSQFGVKAFYLGTMKCLGRKEGQKKGWGCVFGADSCGKGHGVDDLVHAGGVCTICGINQVRGQFRGMADV